MVTRACVCLAAAWLALLAGARVTEAQDSKSAPLAKELVAALEARKLDSIAAKDPAAQNVYVAALYIPGSQLLIVSGAYQEPILLDTRLYHKQYREVYIDLNSASPVATRTLLEDLGADGLRARREREAPADTVDQMGKRTLFDNDWKKQKLSEDDYMKAFSAADERYAQILAALLTEIKKSS